MIKSTKQPDLILHLKSSFFNEIKSGKKTEEYRETKPYWKKRLEGNSFRHIILVKGNYGNERYPENVLTFPWNGYVVKQIGSWEHQEMIEVFAIALHQ